MPNAIWTGSISFGLVTVPVRLVSATRSRDVRFHQLEEGTGARIRYRRVSEATGDEVPNERIVKGYEIEPGRYVVVEADELATLAPKSSREIGIEDFVDLEEIDPVFFEQPYYLLPDKDSSKAYRLLAQVMEEEGKVAIGRFVLRSKEALVAIRPVDGMLCLETMRYSDEVLEPAIDRTLDERGSEPSEREMAMARQLVETLAAPFDPEKYRDEYRDELLGLIDRKAAGEEVVTGIEPPEEGKVLDLMAALEASLARGSDESESTSAESAPSKGSGSRRASGSGKSAKAAAKPDTKSARKAPGKRARKSA